MKNPVRLLASLTLRASLFVRAVSARAVP